LDIKRKVDVTRADSVKKEIRGDNAGKNFHQQGVPDKGVRKRFNSDKEPCSEPGPTGRRTEKKRAPNGTEAQKGGSKNLLRLKIFADQGELPSQGRKKKSESGGEHDN